MSVIVGTFRASTVAWLLVMLGLIAPVAMVLAPATVSAQEEDDGDGDGNITGIGFYPGNISIADALRGQRYERGVVLINSSDYDRTFSFHPEGDFAEWAALATQSQPETPVSEVTVPPHSELPVFVYFDIPDGTPNGTYEGEIRYRSSGTGGQIVLGLSQPVEIEVGGEQILDVQLGDIYARDIEAGQPLRLRAIIQNASNVEVTPAVVASIETSAGVEVASNLQNRTEPLKSGEEKEVTALEWDSSGQQPGAYVMQYELRAQGEVFAEGEVEFRIAPFGELSRSGEIISILFAGSLEPGSMGRADVTFRNSGRIDVLSKFVGELYLDGDLVQQVESRTDMLAEPGNEVVLNVFFPIEQDGNYEIRGRVSFGGIQTDEYTATFSTPGAGGLFSNLPLMAGGGVAIVALLALGLMGARRWRRSSAPAGREVSA